MKNTFFEKIVLSVTTVTKSIINRKMKNYEKQGTQKKNSGKYKEQNLSVVKIVIEIYKRRKRKSKDVSMIYPFKNLCDN